MRILILGASGMLGHKLLQRFSHAGYDVLGTLRERRAGSRLAKLPLFSGDNIVWDVDALDWPRLTTVVQAHRPDVVVNALGIIKQRSLAKVAAPSIQINSLLPHQLAELVAAWHGRLIHVSTDCVFSGSRGGYREDDISDAEDLYGRSKFLGEVSELPNALTLRTSIIGRELRHHQSLLDWVLAQNHRELQGYARVIYSGLTTIEMATVVERVIRQHPHLHGLYHVASSPISKHQLLQLIAAAYRLDVRIHAVDTPVNDRSLNGDRFADDTGYAAPSWADMIATLAADPTPYPEWLSLMRDQSAS
jgi:dTDP-4-dehydrorhamnose reductase